MSQWKKVVLLMIVRLKLEDQAEVEAPLIFLHNCFTSIVSFGMEKKIPRVGGAEKLKLQEAIPPFSLIEASIHGKRAETLVKTA